MPAPVKTETISVLLQPDFFGEYELELACAPVDKALHRHNPCLSYVRLEVRHGATVTHAWVMIATSYAVNSHDMVGTRRFKLKSSPEGLALIGVELFRDGRWIEFVKVD